jgi:hypothetical protein
MIKKKRNLLIELVDILDQTFQMKNKSSNDRLVKENISIEFVGIHQVTTFSFIDQYGHQISVCPPF